MNKKFKSLDLNKLSEKKSTIVSSEKALEDISPINWSKDVLSGKKKVFKVSTAMKEVTSKHAKLLKKLAE